MLKEMIEEAKKPQKTKFSDLRKQLTGNTEHNEKRELKGITGVPYVEIQSQVPMNPHRFSSRERTRNYSGSREKMQGKLHLFGDIIKAQRGSMRNLRNESSREN